MDFYAPGSVYNILPDSNAGALVTANASANTYGSWATVDTVLDQMCQALLLLVGPATTTGGRGKYALDVGIGAAASEQVILSKLMIQGGPGAAMLAVVLPYHVKNAIRIAARCMSNPGGLILRVDVVPFLFGWAPPIEALGRADTYGMTNSAGTQVDPGATVDTKGAWTQITSGVTNLSSYLMVCIGNQANSGPSSGNFDVDIGIGSAGNEIVLVPDLPYFTNASERDVLSRCYALPIELPASTRVSARARSTIIDATDRLLDVSVIGVG